MGSVTFLHADHPQLGRFFAAVDPSVRFAASHCSPTRLGAMLAAFPNEAGAQAALSAAVGYGQAAASDTPNKAQKTGRRRGAKMAGNHG